MLRIKFQDLYCHFIVILNQMVMLFLLKIGELSMIMTQMEKNTFFCLRIQQASANLQQVI